MEFDLRRVSGTVDDRTRWIILLEALDQIQSAEKCGPVAAQVYLKQGIGRGALPVKWADPSGPNDLPDANELRRSQLVLLSPGLAPCSKSPLPRPLLVLRAAVQAAWPRTKAGVASFPEATPSVKAPRGKSEQKYEQWISLVEAIEHIRMSQDCNQVEALRQLKLEVRDGFVRVRWENTKGPRDYPSPRHVGESQLLLAGTGFALDNDEEHYRSLLVERSSVRGLWPLRGRHQRKNVVRTDLQSIDQQGRGTATWKRP